MCTQILSVAVLIRTTHPFGAKKKKAVQDRLHSHSMNRSRAQASCPRTKVSRQPSAMANQRQ